MEIIISIITMIYLLKYLPPLQSSFGVFSIRTGAYITCLLGILYSSTSLWILYETYNRRYPNDHQTLDHDWFDVWLARYDLDLETMIVEVLMNIITIGVIVIVTEFGIRMKKNAVLIVLILIIVKNICEVRWWIGHVVDAVFYGTMTKLIIVSVANSLLFYCGWILCSVFNEVEQEPHTHVAQKPHTNVAHKRRTQKKKQQ